MSGPGTKALRLRARGFGAMVGATHLFRHELWRRRLPLLGGLACSLGYAITGLAEPWPLKFIFDNVLTGLPLHSGLPWVDETIGRDRIRILLAATLAILALAALRGLFYYYQNVLVAGAGQELVFAVRRRLFAHLQRLPLSFHTQSRTGDLLTRLTGDIQMLRELIVSSLLSLVSESLILVGFVVVMLLMDWRLALVALGVIPIVFALVTVYAGRIRETAQKQRRREGELASRAAEVLSGIHVVQMFTREDDEDERLRTLNKRSLKSGLKATRLEAQLNRSVELSIAVATAVALWFGAVGVIEGRLTAGELIVFVAYMHGFYRPLRRISRVTERASKAASSLDRVTEVLELQSQLRDGWRQAPRFAGAILFEAVSFGYRPGRSVLHDIDLEVRPGETVAIVGESGAGKSTLLGMVARLYDPADGRILIDGHDLRDLALKTLREQIGIVPQEGMLFGADVRENIAYGEPEASDAEIEAAARAALIHDEIMALPDGYGTLIGERGATLSGGQRQRIAIARVLVRNARIVLLDEPTTGLDAQAEAIVLEALERLLRGRTALIVTHRLAVVRRADRIVVLHRGRIVEEGTHAGLLERDGRYRALWRLHALEPAPQPGWVGAAP